MPVNTVTISGNLGADAQLRQTQTGSNILSMTVAVSERRKNQSGEWTEYVNWIDCTMFGKRAESIAPYMHKGTKVTVQGKLHQSKWQTQDGQNRSKIEVYVDEIEFMQQRQQQQVSPQVAYAAQQAQAATGYRPPQFQEVTPQQPDIASSVYDSDIPFN